MTWAHGALIGPEDEDWRVPPSELEARQQRCQAALADAGLDSAWVQDPADMYWLVGNRQQGAVHVGAAGVTHYVRKSLARARWAGGEDDAPHAVEAMPRSAELSQFEAPALQLGRLPASDAAFWQSKFGSGGDCTGILWKLRETKSAWEIERMREAGEVQRWMFEAIDEIGTEGATELDLAAAADEVSRAAGFAGHIRMRRWPMTCDRVVIASGASGAVPSYFDSAVGGTGPHPGASLGAGFKRIRVGEPVLVDIVHVHRGYVADMTRMFSVGPLDTVWDERLADMAELALTVREALGRGRTCTEAWREAHALATEMGHAEHLMGMAPDQARFLGHSIGLELDETPVVAEGFDAPLPVGGTMAIEPKVIHPEGAIGVEDCWVREDDGMSCISSGEDFPLWTEW